MHRGSLPWPPDSGSVRPRFPRPAFGLPIPCWQPRFGAWFSRWVGKAPPAAEPTAAALRRHGGWQPAAVAGGALQPDEVDVAAVAGEDVADSVVVVAAAADIVAAAAVEDCTAAAAVEMATAPNWGPLSCFDCSTCRRCDSFSFSLRIRNRFTSKWRCSQRVDRTDGRKSFLKFVCSSLELLFWFSQSSHQKNLVPMLFSSQHFL